MINSEMNTLDNSESAISKQNTADCSSEQLSENEILNEQSANISFNNCVSNIDSDNEQLHVINKVSSSIVDLGESIETPVEHSASVVHKNGIKDGSHSPSDDNEIDSDNESVGNRTNNKHKKKHNFIGSDSEDEETTIPPIEEINDEDPEQEDNLSSNECNTTQKKKSRLRKISDDSDSENETNQNENTSNIETSTKESRLKQIVDSDSEDEAKLEQKLNNENIFDEEQLQKEQASRLKNICDSESSAEEPDDCASEEVHQTKKSQNRKKSDKPVEKMMTGRDAMEQRQLIKSESQKMVRETRVSLPYHRPKQHTLHEFLKRRSRTNESIDVSPNIPTSFAIKMYSRERFKTIERLKEREKEIEEFYKVESDSENADVTTNTLVEEINSNVDENLDESVKDILEQIDSILEPEKHKNLEETENVSSNEDQNDEEVSAKVQELRDTLAQYSCGTDSNMEQLMEQPEPMDCEILEEVEELEINENVEESVQPQEDPVKIAEIELDKIEETTEIQIEIEKPTDQLEETEEIVEKLSEDFIESHFTASFQTTAQIENAKETPDKEDELEKKLKNLNPIISLKKDFKPRLTGDGGDFVVLDEGLERSKGVSNLMKRFFMQISKETSKKTDAVAAVPVHQDLIIPKDDESNDAAKKNTTPGLKFKKLKENLQEHIKSKRIEEWKKRQEEEMNAESGNANDGEKTECGLDDDEEDEEEISDEESSDDSSEEDEEDDVVVLQDKPTVKSAFVDDEAEESDEEDESEEDDETGKKPLKRILNTFDDSDEEILDEEIPGAQPQRDVLEKTPCKPITPNKNDFTTILTPTFHLTALQGMNSASKVSISESPGIVLSPDPSPLRSHPLLKTKLFTEPEDANIEDLENLCSGKFTGPTQHFTEDDLATPSTDLCSEKQQNESSENFHLSFNNDSLDEKLSESNSKEEITVTQSDTNVPLQFQKLNVSKFAIVSSDEEGEAITTETKKTKTLTKRKKYIIDDISVTDDEDVADVDDFDDEDVVEDDPKNIDYDSEENEVEYDAANEIDETDQLAAKKARDYFEAEAELSGSDWDSADEDEKGLDDFEAEDGDAEHINQKKLQRELGRIHAHSVLEEDKRDVRLLQELLLEDGELHGAGREKKFKWKNADAMNWNDDKNNPNEDDEEIEEAENEQEWRKMRHERETFLKEQQSKEPAKLRFTNDSQIMELGKEALEKSDFNTQHKTPVAESIIADDDIKLPFTLTHKRGSFLTRSDTILARIADITGTSSGILNNGPKNSRNFLFTSLQKSEFVADESNEKKRKADPSTPAIIKKLRMTDMSPAGQKFRKRILE